MSGMAQRQDDLALRHARTPFQVLMRCTYALAQLGTLTDTQEEEK